MNRLVIIGAGLAGVTLARQCANTMAVTVIEKSRGLAGRMSTRRLEDQVFDHGAQYFTVRDDRFADTLVPFVDAGIVVPWQARFVTISSDRLPTPRRMTSSPMIATPGMTGLVKAMSEGLTILTGIEAASIMHSQDGNWQVKDTDGTLIAEADMIVTAIPAAQAARLLPEHCVYHKQLHQVKMDGCFTLMLGFDQCLQLPWDAAFVEDSPLGFVADNASRPNRQGGTALTVQSTNTWAEQHLDLPSEDVIAHLNQALKDHLGINAGGAVRHRLHRWRYASVSAPLGQPYLLDENLHLASVGDWCLRGRVEAAFQSATALGDNLVSDMI